MMNFNKFKSKRKKWILTLAVLSMLTACERDLADLEDVPFSNNPLVFEESFSAGLEYAAFGGSKVTAFDTDNEVVYDGQTSMRFSVPDQGDPEGSFAGGAFISTPGRNLTEYNALTFWAKASQAANVDELGFGNYLGGNEYATVAFGLPVTTNWQQYYLPIPNASKLTSERGLLFFSESPEDDRGYTFWLDEVKFVNLGTLTGLKGRIQNGQRQEQVTFNGVQLVLSGFSSSINTPTGVDQTVFHGPLFFDFVSSDPSVATVDENGVVSVVGEGIAEITATLGDVEAEGALVVISLGEFENAPVPEESPEDVISVFSDAYTNVPVDFYNGFWEPFQTTLSADFEVDGDNVLNYTNFNFVGTQFSSPTVDASAMTHIHFDLFFPGSLSAGSQMTIRVRDFGPDGSDGGGDDSDQVIVLSSSDLQSSQWNEVDVELNIANRSQMGLIIYEGQNISNFYADNIYFYKTGGNADDMPTVAAPVPTHPAADVISIFSDSYNDIGADTYRTVWSMAQLEETDVQGNNVLRYFSLDFVGIETVANQIDATEMTHVHVDVWSPNFSQLRLKIVDFGPDGGFDGGDDTEHEVTYESPAQGEWVSYDIPLADFVNLTNRQNLAQYIFSAQPAGLATVYVDNLYFYKQ